MTLQLLTILTAAGGMALVALTYNAYPVYFMFAALSAVVLISYACSRLPRRALGARRRVADRVFVGDPLRVRVEVTNRGHLPRFLLAIKDLLPPFLECDGPAEMIVPSLWPGDSVSIEYQARARKRGAYSLGPLDISVSDPFGVFQRHVPVPERSEAIVYPRPLPLHAEVARAGLQPRGTGPGERAAASQSSLEFYGIRDYQPGDELRRIHWPATAHHSRLMVIEFDRGGAESVTVVLDNRAGTEFGRGTDTTLETAVTAAASLIHWVLMGEGAAGLVTDSAHGARWLAADSPDREQELFEALARLQADGSIPASGLLEWALARSPQAGASPGLDGGMVCLITAVPDEGLPDVIGSLGHLSGRERRDRTSPPVGRVAVLLLDAHSFDPRARHAAGEQARQWQTSEMGSALAAAGAAVSTVRREDDLGQALGRLLGGG